MHMYVRICLFICVYMCGPLHVCICMSICYDNVTIYILYFNIWVALATAVICNLSEGLPAM